MSTIVLRESRVASSISSTLNGYPGTDPRYYRPLFQVSYDNALCEHFFASLECKLPDRRIRRSPRPDGLYPRRPPDTSEGLGVSVKTVYRSSNGIGRTVVIPRYGQGKRKKIQENNPKRIS